MHDEVQVFSFLPVTFIRKAGCCFFKEYLSRNTQNPWNQSEREAKDIPSQALDLVSHEMIRLIHANYTRKN